MVKKLNLGCGSSYKPGYINIDKSGKSTADKIQNIENLNIKENTIDLIEAPQLIEHFDYIHCKYILSDWFKILKPHGTLIIETPDLEKTFKKFINSNPDEQKTSLQWIYGIDSFGMQHKTGFAFDLLKSLLEEIGFEKISRKQQETHKYEPGMRIECRKPKSFYKKQFISSFRKRIIKKINDSYLLIPLEKYIRQINYLFEKDEDSINEIISKTAVVNPIIAKLFLEEYIKFKKIRKSDFKNKLNLIGCLNKIRFHEKVFTLWINRKKNTGEINKDFQNFVHILENLLLDILNNKTDCKEKLSYISALKPSKIDAFDYNLVLIEAKNIFNLAVKNFHNKKYREALALFIKSSKINPGNPLNYWNIARLGIILKLEKNEIMQNYEKTAALLNRKDIEAELKNLKNNKLEDIPKKTIPEF